MGRLDNKVTVITGGASGMGRVAARIWPGGGAAACTLRSCSPRCARPRWIA